MHSDTEYALVTTQEKRATHVIEPPGDEQNVGCFQLFVRLHPGSFEKFPEIRRNFFKEQNIEVNIK